MGGGRGVGGLPSIHLGGSFFDRACGLSSYLISPDPRLGGLPRRRSRAWGEATPHNGHPAPKGASRHYATKEYKQNTSRANTEWSGLDRWWPTRRAVPRREGA